MHAIFAVYEFGCSYKYALQDKTM